MIATTPHTDTMNAGCSLSNGDVRLVSLDFSRSMVIVSDRLFSSFTSSKHRSGNAALIGWLVAGQEVQRSFPYLADFKQDLHLSNDRCKSSDAQDREGMSD